MDDQTLKKIAAEEEHTIFLDQKLQFTYPIPQASIKDVRALEEAFTPQKRTSSTFVGHFCPPGSRYGATDLIESGSGSETLVRTGQSVKK